MRWTLRVICLASVLVAVAALFARGAFIDSKQALSISASESAPDLAGHDNNEASPKPATTEEQDGAGESPTNGNNDHGRPLENGMIRALDQMLDQTSPALGDEEDALRDSLVDADLLLTQIKRDNRRAMREANRQVRVPGLRSPNILLIVAEELGANDLLVGPVETTPLPNLRSLVDQGTEFESFYAGASVDQAHAALHSGRLGGNSRKHMAATLWQAGYSTAIIGDCSRAGVAGGGQEQHGFDLWFGWHDEVQQPHEFPTTAWSNGREIRVPANSSGKQEVTAIELLLNEALAHFQSHRRGRPFFLQFDLPAVKDRGGTTLEVLDRTVGVLAAGLRRVGVSNNTVVILVGTGSSSQLPNAPLRTGQHGLYDGQLRAPLIISWPVKKSRLATCANEVACLADILPTLTDAVGAIRSPNMEGTPLWALDAQRRRVLLWTNPNNTDARAARTGRWKAIFSDTTELYDANDDPSESSNVADANADIVSQLREAARPSKPKVNSKGKVEL